MDDVLRHHGIKGQKWGIRRFQNKDGTLTSAGKKRYDNDDGVDEKGDKSHSTKSKVVVGAATGMAFAAGAIITAHVVKKYSGQKVSDLVENASSGKDLLQDILQSTPVAKTPVNCIPIPKAPIGTAPVARTTIPTLQSYDLGPAGFELLMKQNDALLKKMLAELS